MKLGVSTPSGTPAEHRDKVCGARSGDTRFPLKGTPPSVVCPCRCAAPSGSRGPIKPRASYAAGRARQSWSVCQNSLSPYGRAPWDLAVCAVGGWLGTFEPRLPRGFPTAFLLAGLRGVRVGLRPSTPASWNTQRGPPLADGPILLSGRKERELTIYGGSNPPCIHTNSQRTIFN